MRKILAILSIIMLSSIFIVPSTFGCSCIEPKYPLEAVDDANIVFIGKVSSIETISKTMGTFPNQFKAETNKVDFQVSMMIKGGETSTIQVSTPKDSATCGFNFEEGKEYIVYSNPNKNNELNVSLCSRTALLENASEDLAVLNIQNVPSNSNENVNTETTEYDFEGDDHYVPESYILENEESNKNIYVGVFLGILTLALITFIIITMNKKD